MGLLSIPTKNKERVQDGNENIRHFKRSNYSNPDAVRNLIRYITRTRENESRAQDLLAYGAVGAGYYLHPDDIIQQFLYVQNAHGINSRGGKRMHHEVFNLYDSEAMELGNDPYQLWLVGMKCCEVYYRMGFQAVFAVHWQQDKRYHFHFAINNISFVNGLKLHTSMSMKGSDQGEGVFPLEELDQMEGTSPLEKLHIRNEIFNQILLERQKAYQSEPLYFVHPSFTVSPVPE